MKLFYAATSPFVRKCLVSARELGLVDRIELVPATASPVNRDRNVVACNPLGKIPTLVTDDGATLCDSRVICEYLNALGNGTLLPASGARRFEVLTEQSVADGVADAAVLIRYETFLRPESRRWDDWTGGQFEKITSGLGHFEARAERLADRLDLGTIALGCCLGYLDFRFSALGWRGGHPGLAGWFDAFARRDSMRDTAPPF